MTDTRRSSAEKRGSGSEVLEWNGEEESGAKRESEYEKRRKDDTQTDGEWVRESFGLR